MDEGYKRYTVDLAELGEIYDLVPLRGKEPKVCDEVYKDNCGVCGGDGTSCAASMLAQVWRICPEACSQCEDHHRGCIAFSPIFVSRANLPLDFMRLLGINIFGTYLIDTPIWKLIFACQMLLAGSCFIDLIFYNLWHRPFGIPDELFYIIGDKVVTPFVGELAWMPMAVLSAQICPASVEATLFAFLMSCLNTGYTLSGMFGGWLLRYMEFTK